MSAPRKLPGNLETNRTLDRSLLRRARKLPKGDKLNGATIDLSDTIAELERFVARGRKT